MAGESAVSVYLRRQAGAAGFRVVADFAAAQGFAVAAEDVSRRCAVLRGAADVLAGALHPIPELLRPVVEAVFGPDGYGEGQPSLPHPAVALTSGAGETPAALAASLGLPEGDGAGHCVGIVSCGGTVRRAAMEAACAALGIAPPAQRPHLVVVDDAPPAPEAPDGPLLPMLLILAALAPKAKVMVYAAPPTARGWIDAVSAAIHDLDNRPSVVCTGWTPPQPDGFSAHLAAEADRIGVRLFLPDDGHRPGRLAAPEAGKSWTGGAIDAALHAAARLRAPLAPSVLPAAPQTPPPRPHFDALTVTAHPAAALHRAQVAYETDRFPGPAHETPLPVQWRLLPWSAARDLAAGGDGSLWALGALAGPGGHPLYRWTGLFWAPAWAGGLAVAADADGRPWLVDAFGTLLRFTGTDWRPERGQVAQIAVGASGALWGLARAAGPHGGAVLHRASPDADWTEAGAQAERIALAPDGTPWIVTPAGEALRREGEAWTRQARNVRDIAIGPRGEAWVASRRGGRIYRRMPGEAAWRRAEGVAHRLAATPDGAVWAITPLGHVAVGVVAETPQAAEGDGPPPRAAAE
ncbi:MAG: hypothetical protein JSR21_02465 [Proteobacteria bacterium]|nr:hypothetical protein [Pseudomonadota bacterium]